MNALSIKSTFTRPTAVRSARKPLHVCAAQVRPEFSRRRSSSRPRVHRIAHIDHNVVVWEHWESFSRLNYGARLPAERALGTTGCLVFLRVSRLFFSPVLTILMFSRSSRSSRDASSPRLATTRPSSPWKTSPCTRSTRSVSSGPCVTPAMTTRARLPLVTLSPSCRRARFRRRSGSLSARSSRRRTN